MNNYKPIRTRFGILAFLFINVVINYMDRANIAIAAPAIGKEMQWSNFQLGAVFSAFGWAYVAAQIPGGLLIDRIGARLLYTISLICWSVVTLCQGLIKGFAVLLGLRLAIGMFEAPAYPLNNRIVSSWFPEQERASAIAVYTSGQFIGLAFLTPILALIQHYLGWRGLFVVTGLTGICWGIIWYLFYRDKAPTPAVPGKIKPAITRDNLKQVLNNRQLWGIYLGQFAVTSTLWFFLTWFPTYLVKYRGLDFLKTGLLTSVPFMAAFAGVLLAGFFSDQLLKKGSSFAVARKTPVIGGLVLSMVIIGANYVQSNAWVITLMSLAFFGNGLASITWVFVSELAPRNLIGAAGGVFNFFGGLSAIVVPLVVGWLAGNGNFVPALWFIGVLAFSGVLSYIFLVGNMKKGEQLAMVNNE